MTEDETPRTSDHHAVPPPARPPVPDSVPPPARPAVPGTPQPVPAGAGHQWFVVAAAVAGLAVGAAAFLALRTPVVPAEAAPRAAAADATAGAMARTPVAPVSAASAPKWQGGEPRGRGRDASIVFELPAERDVAVWNRRVLPVLTIRCYAGTTEVFVLTHSAAAMDGNDGTHAVRLAFDTNADEPARWVASEEYDALFAPDAAATARRIAAAQTLRFAYTPYNASPVVITFDVRGFDQRIETLARTCRW